MSLEKENQDRIDAERFRKLMRMKGAERRIWNHVLDDFYKEDMNSVREALDNMIREDQNGNM